MSKLQFGTLTGVSTIGFNAEIKENLSMSNGLATIEQVDLQTKVSEETSAEYPAIGIRMRAVDSKKGSGCYDTVTTRTPSKTVLGLERLKYLFNAIGQEFPAFTFFLFATNAGQDIFTLRIVEALTKFQANGGKVEDVALLDAQGRIVIASVTAFEQVFGKDSGISYLYANLGKVGDMRAKYNRALSKITDPAERELKKQEYLQALHAEPVVPCEINLDEFRQLYEMTANLPKDVMVYVKTGNAGKQVTSYMVARLEE